jgi:hypothetical protein
MSNTDDIPLLERPAFFHNQRLTANDLTAAQTYNRELRWLHNRSLHSWGIAFGFVVTGLRGAQSVTVLTGYAVDCVGRDLVLDKALDLPIPAVASDSNGSPAIYYLTISYAEDADLEPVNRAGECNSSGAVRRPEMPIVRWQDPNDLNPDSRYRQGFDVVLGAIRVLNCQLADDISGRERRYAIPPQQPYIAAGRSQPGNTPWHLFPNDNAPLGVATTVATSGAGFQNTPRYQANVVGERLFQAAPGSETIVVDGSPQIAQVTASSFELRVLLPTGTTVGNSQTDIFNQTDYFAVVSRIALAKGIPKEIILMFNPFLSIGQRLFTLIPFWQDLGPLEKNDFQSALNGIASRNGVSRAALLQANDWTLNKVAVAFGQTIALPGPALHMNPKKVLKPTFMDVLKTTLAWHVVWMGVEG